MGIERRQRVVHFLQFRFDGLLQIFVVLVGNFVDGAKHESFVGAERRLLFQDDEGAHYQNYQEGHLPIEFLFIHKYFKM